MRRRWIYGTDEGAEIDVMVERPTRRQEKIMFVLFIVLLLAVGAWAYFLFL